MASADHTLYCLCRQPYDGDRFMIECDVCKDWFHGSCVGVQEIQAPDIETFHCPSCQIEHGPLTLKKRRNWHRHDYSELDDGIGKTQSGTVKFVQELKSRTFPSPDQVIRLQGHQVRKEYFDEHGFEYPILVHRLDGLGLRVPPPNFTILDVENYVGSMREIDVIDVSRQEDYKMLMREWTEYYNSPNRTKIFNVISLEFSKTKLAEIVQPPEVVRQVSWASTLWPENLPQDSEFEKPKVQRYCLMGVKDSYTDFHVDFGGTSVWYHVLRGEKIFFLIKPTPANLQLYENWLSSANQSECFFGDQTDSCYRQVVKQGQTIFIPSGWIHAVLTPIDSLVFGGNFLHSYAIDMQILAYDMEKRVKTPDKYLFPNFETVHWYAAKHFHDYLVECQDENKDPKPAWLNASKSLAAALKVWTHKRDYVKREFIPDSIQYGKLLKDLNKVLKSTMQKVNAKIKQEEKGKRKGKKKDLGVSPKGLKDLEDLHSQTEQALEKMSAENASKLATGQKGKKGKAAGKDKGGGNAPKLKMKIAKGGSLDTSVYDFDDEEEGRSLRSPPGRSPPQTRSSPGIKSPPPNMRSPQAKLKGVKGESPVKSDPGSVGSSPLKARPGSSSPLAAELEAKLANIKAASSSALKLKLFNGKVISGEGQAQTPGGKFQLLGAQQEEVKKEESDDEEDAGLVVDENPAKPRKRRAPPDPNAIKLKVPIKGEGMSSPGPSQPLPPGTPLPPEGPFTQLKKAVPDDDEDDLADRMNMPTIRGGLNGSIADILEASGYGTETDFKIDDDIGRRAASPTMRDAIQGMLSMSRMTGLSPLTMDGVSPFIDNKAKTTIRLQRDQRDMRAGQKRKYTYSDDTGESMPTCFKDDDYVYPTLDLSDTEDDHVFKPRGRPKKDETWNPKAKLEPNAPKPERPQREGTRKESVESGLAAAAARLATQPPPKRQYIRKKPKTPKLESPPSESPTSDLTSLPSTSAFGISNISLTPPSIMPTPNPPPPAKVMSPKPAAKPAGTKAPAPAPQLSVGPNKKPVKKGMATAKQRLGKILGMGKMFR